MMIMMMMRMKIVIMLRMMVMTLSSSYQRVSNPGQLLSSELDPVDCSAHPIPYVYLHITYFAFRFQSVIVKGLLTTPPSLLSLSELLNGNISTA